MSFLQFNHINRHSILHIIVFLSLALSILRNELIKVFITYKKELSVVTRAIIKHRIIKKHVQKKGHPNRAAFYAKCNL